MSTPAGTNAQTPTSAMPSLASMLENVLPGVVSIVVRGHEPAQQDAPEGAPPPGQIFEDSGSGVIVDAEAGYILTNFHVIANAEKITVTLIDGRVMAATTIGADAETDLAVLQIEANNLTALPFGNSDQLRVGDYVVAVGNPFGLAHTATMGIVSALGRTGLGLERYENFIQTDASINPGNSGGALVNVNGELIGINAAIAGPEQGNVGIGFAIPISMAHSVMTELIADGEVRRGQLGVTVQDLTPDLAKALELDLRQGAIVDGVIAGSPAQKAGIEPGDSIIAINGQPVSDASDLTNQIGTLPVDAKVQVTLVGKTGSREVPVVLTQGQPITVDAPPDVPLLATVELGSIASSSQVCRCTEGVAVVAVAANTPADFAGLTMGDVIVRVNQQAVSSPEDVITAARQNKDLVLLQVMRGGGMLFIVIS